MSKNLPAPQLDHFTRIPAGMPFTSIEDKEKGHRWSLFSTRTHLYIRSLQSDRVARYPLTDIVEPAIAHGLEEPHSAAAAKRIIS